MKLFLSIVIPCYNEEQNIRLGSLDKVALYIEKQKYSWEVIIVDDGSSDESLLLIQEFARSNKGFKVVANLHQGKAGTVVKGMLTAVGDYILFTDLDQATPLDQLEKLMLYVHDYDVVIGSRKGRRQGAPLLRRLMGPGFMFVRNLILGLGKIQDTQCGFKLFKRETAQNVFSRLKLYGGIKHASGARVTAGVALDELV